MRYPPRAYDLLWATVALLGFVLMLSACDASSGGQGATHAQSTATAAASAASTSTPAYATPLATAVPTTGWAIYHDHRYPFQMPIPPGWQTGVVTWPQQGSNGCAYYSVGIFPPGVKPILQFPLGEFNQEMIELTIHLTCTAREMGPGAGHWQAEATPVIMSGVPATVYDQIEVEGTRDSIAAANFGELEYGVYVKSPPGTAARDVSVFRAILGGFKYTGK